MSHGLRRGSAEPAAQHSLAYSVQTPGHARPSWVWSSSPNVVVAIVAVLALAAYVVVYVHYLNPHEFPPIRSDGVGYYSYLPAYLLEDDPTFHKFVSHDLRGMSAQEAGFSLNRETGNFVNQYSIGEALMLLPFFLAGHAASLVTHHHADGFSAFEQAAVGLGGLTFMVLGLLVLGQTMRRYFSDRVVSATLVTMVFGTNLFHYGTGDSIFSHAFSFFLIATMIEIVHRWYERRTVRNCLGLGLVLGLIVLVRQANLILWLFVPLFGLGSTYALRERLRLFAVSFRSAALVLAAAAMTFVPQLFAWHYGTGHWLIYSYGPYHFNFRNPRILDVLFSINPHGALFWSPGLILAVAGIPWMWSKARPMLLPTLVLAALFLYLAASWPFWWYGGGYGHRGFIDIYPLLAVALASLFGSLRSLASRIAIGGAAALACLLVTVQMVHYWQLLFPFEGASLTRYVSALTHPLW